MSTAVSYREYMSHQRGEKEPILVAVSGTGSIGSRHIQVLKRIQEVLPVAVPRRPERVTELHQSGIRSAANIREAAEMGARLCIIATDTARHHEDSLVALECGMDLLVEKPLAINTLRGWQICDAADKAGRRVFVGCCLRFSESLDIFRRQLARIGKLNSVRIVCQSYLPDWRPDRDYKQSYSARGDEGGVLRDLIHEIDYAGWIFGWPQRLQSILRNSGSLGIESEETADLMWETEQGFVVSLRLDYLSKITRRGITACGEEGVLEWNAVAGTVVLSRDGKQAQQIESSQTRNEMMTAQAQVFLQSARANNEGERLATGIDGVWALAICDAARKASKSRAEIKVEYGRI